MCDIVLLFLITAVFIGENCSEWKFYVVIYKTLSRKTFDMLAVKGVCTLCKEELSIFNSGLVCFKCEKFYHGSCCKPPQDLKALQNYVLEYSSWYCEKCFAHYRKNAVLRSNESRIDVEKKIDLLNQIRDLILKIEETIQAMADRCKEMNDSAVALSLENAELRKHISLHEKFLKKKPKDFKQWKERRKILGVNKREKRGIKYWLPLNTDAVSKRKQLAVYIKQQEGLTEREANKAVVTNTEKKKEKILKHKAPDSSLLFKIYEILTNLSNYRLANLLLIVIILIYTLLGAMVYRYVEGNYEKDLRDQILKERSRLDVNGNNTEEQIRHYFEFVSEIFGNHTKVLSRGDEDLSWGYIDSVYFCGMTYTSVGYGDITPMTSLGKIFTIFYAFFGIPMFLLLLSTLGHYVCKGIIFDVSLLTAFCLKICLKKNKYVHKLNQIEEYEDERRAIVDQGWGVLLYFIVTLILVFLVGAVVFMVGENLNFLPSLYFVFITLSTLGFGEIVPENRTYMLASVFYIVIGLVLVSTGINALMYILNEKIFNGFRKLGNKLDEMETGDYSDEDSD